MDARLKELVRRRAGFRCEYCHLPEPVAELPFQFDHIVAQQHGGVATADNLALACVRCNRYKGRTYPASTPNRERLHAFSILAPTSGMNISSGKV